MTHERRQRVKEIFHSALELAPERRAAFLAAACAGQDSLCREVESLISSHEKTGHFIDAPAFQAVAEMLTDGQEFKSGETLGHYEIHSVLGEGGMGKVYLAEDRKLKRKVALKVLPAANRGDEETRRRLLHEAQAAAALDHPNICAIYEVDEAGDHSYIAMQYVEGETLEARMAKGRISIDGSLNIAVQVADALSEAHAHNIIHRDIKPSNIMLANRGQVKVLDFGLAKNTSPALVGPNEAETKRMLTAPGMILGTVPYMSPEQLRGESVDARSDIFSFGVVLYEMLSGQPAFGRSTDAETIGAILHEQPELSSINPSVPEALAEVVSKCLAKDVARRYQTVQQVAHDLNAARNGEPAATKTPAIRTVKAGIARRHKRSAALLAAAVIVAVALFGYYFYFAKGGEAIDSIAVLPFVNVSNDADAEYLSDGLSDSLINSLSQLPNLKKVISLSSVLRYKGQQPDAAAVGRELNVRAVLMGRLTQHGDELLISAELVDVKDNKRLWGRQYKSKLAEILPLQGEIAQEITERLRLKLTGEEKRRLAKRDTADPEAYRLYSWGRFYRRNRDHQKARDSLEQAIKKDPNYAPAYAQLAYTYSNAVVTNDWFSRKEARERMEWAARKALELDDTLGDAHAALALTIFDWSVRSREFERALELDPNSADVHFFYAGMLWSRRRTDEAVLHMKRAVELDPLSPAMQSDLGKILYSAGQRAQAMEQYRRALDLNPNYVNVHKHLASFYLAEGRYEEAIAEAEKWSANAPDKGAGRSFLGYTYAVAGQRAEAEKILHELQAEAKQRRVSSDAIALIYTGLGDKDRAFEFLRKEVEEDKSLPFFINVLPEWDSLRTDPRFEQLIRQSEFHRE
jgi:serine/threonine protein kinase/Tfp pilus assembly protein PilF